MGRVSLIDFQERGAPHKAATVPLQKYKERACIYKGGRRKEETHFSAESVVQGGKGKVLLNFQQQFRLHCPVLDG